MAISDVDPGPGRERYRGLAPSDKLVLASIEVGEDSRAEIAELTLLSERTLDNALRRLRDADLVRRRADPRDGRRTIYVIRDDVETPLLAGR